MISFVVTFLLDSENVAFALFCLRFHLSLALSLPTMCKVLTKGIQVSVT
jgi:hypothetical protein